MIGYFMLAIFVVLPLLLVIVTITVCCCCGLCHRRKPEDEEDVAEVVLYPEDPQNSNRRDYEPYSQHFEGTIADHDQYYSQLQNERYYRHHRIHIRIGDQQVVTGAVVGSELTRDAKPCVGTVVCEPSNVSLGRSVAGVREPVSYGEAVYVSRHDNTTVPTAQVEATTVR